MAKLIRQIKVNGQWRTVADQSTNPKSRPKRKKKRKANKPKPSKKLNRRKTKSFLKTDEWHRARYDALKRSNGKCQLCGRSSHEGAILNVDHIKPRRKFPELALKQSNLQVLCGACNRGKGNRDQTDWRPKDLKIDPEVQEFFQTLQDEKNLNL